MCLRSLTRDVNGKTFDLLIRATPQWFYAEKEADVTALTLQRDSIYASII